MPPGIQLQERRYILPHCFPSENTGLFRENYRVFGKHCLMWTGVRGKRGKTGAFTGPDFSRRDEG
jgi:hypothetical protein